jgi:formate hydrogenlyase subunit 3/multisubunit Na+/H+ antiporter MnhD subunit
MVWVVVGLCALALWVIFATTEKGTVSIVLGSLMLIGTVTNLDRLSTFSLLYESTFAAVALLWGISYKLEARFPVPAKRKRQPTR